LPLYQYDHSAGDCSIIGSAMYRADSSVLRGLYFFGDFCTGRIWSINPASGARFDRTAQLGAAAGVRNTLVDIGEDGLGRPLIVHRTGNIYRLGLALSMPGCGFGPELLLVLPALAAARRRHGRA
jgi:hypothetical protein